MEGEALYRAILAAPHDDTPRLVYADWLDESADGLPPTAARAQKARAEFIRVQCKLARFHPAGWRAPGPPRTDPELFWRQKRLLFTQGRKWRREAPVSIASEPFDRGFLRPYRSLSAHYFPRHTDESFRSAPLWDLHLYASLRHNDPFADRGQYGPVLEDIGRSPALERIGWLKVSFFRTPAAVFLRVGNFVNVETLVLNCGPFPEVLEAVAANESFRNLRYVRFGEDTWAWRNELTQLLRYNAIAPKLEEANGKHLPYGAMRAELRRILGRAAAEPIPPELVPLIIPHVPRAPRYTGATPQEGRAAAGVGVGCLLVLAGALFAAITAPKQSLPTMPQIRVPDFKPVEVPKLDPKLQQILDDLKRKRRPVPLEWQPPIGPWGTGRDK